MAAWAEVVARYPVRLTAEQWDRAYVAVKRYSTLSVANRIYDALQAQRTPGRPDAIITVSLAEYGAACIAESLPEDSPITRSIYAQVPAFTT